MVCVACNQPLVLEIEHDGDGDVEMGASSSGQAHTETVPDDVQLNCGCHFHWRCLLDAYDITQCPNCSQNIATPSPTGIPQVLCNLHNEGGFQERLDILPLLTEESYLKAYPEDRICRAFLEFCREGDFEAIVDILQDAENEDEDDEDEDDNEPPVRKIGADELLRYQDPIGENQSGLHAAVQGGSREVVWLLLLLASNLDLTGFPPEVFQKAEELGLMRGDMTGKTDIRSLRDSDGKSTEDLAREIGGVWVGWPGTGRLTI